VTRDSIDYAARALHLNRGDERAAVELLVQWCHSRSDVREAFIPFDELQKRVKRAVREIKRERSRLVGRLALTAGPARSMLAGEARGRGARREG
jgi:hypothetical protein